MFRGQGKPLCDVTSEPRPEAETGTQENRLAWFLMSQMAGALHLRAHCRQMAVLNSLFVLRLIMHGDIF